MLVPINDAPSFTGMPSLVWAYAFNDAGVAQPLDPDNLDGDRLAQARQQHVWLWLHYDASDARTAQAIAQLDLPEMAAETLISHDTHVSLHLEGDTAFGVFVDWRHQRGIDPSKHSFARSEKEVGWLHFVLGEGLLVSRVLPRFHGRLG